MAATLTHRITISRRCGIVTGNRFVIWRDGVMRDVECVGFGPWWVEVVYL